MALNDVKDKILEEAQERAKQLHQEAEEEVQKLHDSVDHELQDYEKKLRVNAQRMVESSEKREIAAAEFEGKRLLLDKRKELISAVIRAAEKKLVDMSDAQRSQLLGKLLKNAQKEISVKRVFVNENDVQLLQKHATGLDVMKRDMDGGLITENSDGTIRVDYSFDTMLTDIRQRYIREISEVLFGR